jgi:hypothetical protein
MAVKRYDGSAWQTVAGLGAQGAAATSSSIATWVKTASGGETSLSGNDDNSQALSYTVGQELLFINGVLQKRGVDYTATTGTTITGLSALTANDIVTVWTVNAFSVTNAISSGLVTTTGDLIYASSANTPARLGIGSTGQVLTVSGGVPSWAAASTGKIAQLVTDSTATEVTSTTSTWIDSGLNITITPTASTSTLIFWFSSFSRKNAGNADNYVELKLALTTGGDIAEYGYNFQEGENGDFGATIAGVAYTSAGSTSARTYRLYLRSQGGSGASSSIAADGKGGYIMCMEVLA